MPQHTRRLRPLAATSIACALVMFTPATASAAPSTTTTGTSPGVGALPVDATISAPPQGSYPAAAKSSAGCSYPEVLAPSGRPVRHIAPCQTGTGSGTGSSPWRSVASAMANLGPGEVAYVHDGPQQVDYRESNLRPAKDGTGPDARIRLMAAPGERPWIGRSASSGTAQPIFHLTRPWWVLQGLNLDAAGQLLQAPVVRVGTGAAAPQAHHIVLQKISSRNASVPKSVIEFDGAHNSALLDSIGSTATGPVGLIEPLDANGRPRNVPANGSGDYTDHHAITVVNGADKILIRNNESAGHNGDSLQCGEGATPTSNITVENNRFHQDEENAIDLKGCRGVTIRGNKIFGYRPARPYNTDGRIGSRAPQGDALVAHTSTTAADRLLIELNRFWDNSRSVNLAPEVATATVRRNLIFNASTASCGIGAGMAVRSKNTEIYHNTLDNLAPLTTVGCGNPWSVSEKYAIRVNPPANARIVLWNNIVSRATHPYTQSGSFGLDAATNLFSKSFTGMPPGSRAGDPRYVTDPANNDYFTQHGSPARDAATRVPSSVGDPRRYCDDPSPTETDSLVEPDIGFLESCS
jgi:hypothetical protein